MAKIVQNVIAIEISRIAKDGVELEDLITSEMILTIEEVVQQLVGDNAVVEVKGLE